MCQALVKHMPFTTGNAFLTPLVLYNHAVGQANNFAFHSKFFYAHFTINPFGKSAFPQ